MSRASDAYDKMEAAVNLLTLAGTFCAQPESFEVFRAYARKGIRELGPNAPEGYEAAALRIIDTLTPEVLDGACGVLWLFLDGYRDQMRAVSDDVLDRAARKVQR